MSDLHSFGEEWTQRSTDVLTDFGIDYQGIGWYEDSEGELLFIIGPDENHRFFKCIRYPKNARVTMARMASAPFFPYPNESE